MLAVGAAALVEAQVDDRSDDDRATSGTGDPAPTADPTQAVDIAEEDAEAAAWDACALLSGAGVEGPLLANEEQASFNPESWGEAQARGVDSR